MQEALEEQNKARIEQAKKMDILIKRMDHMERARRENEAPLLQEAYAQKIKVTQCNGCTLALHKLHMHIRSRQLNAMAAQLLCTRCSIIAEGSGAKPCRVCC